MFSRRRILVSSANGAALLIGNGLSASQSFAAPPTDGSRLSSSFRPLALGGGGYVTGIDIHADGTMAARVDVLGGCIGSTNRAMKWKQIININSMPPNTVGFDSGGNYIQPIGIYEIRIAPSDSSVWYMTYKGTVYRSSNKGVTWARTTLTGLAWAANENDAYRTTQQKIAIDPNNSSVVVVGTPRNGAYYTTNGGATWTPVNAIPTSLADGNGVYPGINCICFDSTSGITRGKANTVYALSYGHGVYRTTETVTGSWSRLGGSPNAAAAATMNDSAFLCAAGNSLEQFSEESWNTLYSSRSGPLVGVAVNPKNVSNIVVSDGTRLNQTTNGGRSWSGNYVLNVNSRLDIPWFDVALRNSNATFYSLANVIFDPADSDKLWMPMGIGVLYTTNFSPSLSTWSHVLVSSHTAGIESLVGREVISPIGGNPIISVEDRQEFTITDPAVYPSTYGVGRQSSSTLYSGWQVDFAKSSPSTIVALNISPAINSGAELSGISTDAGTTWSTFGAMPFGGAGSGQWGGAIAASTTANFVAMCSHGPTNARYTTDGGSNWADAAGLPTEGWPAAYQAWDGYKWLCADGATANTFYLWNFSKGLYVSTNGGASWSNHVGTGAPPAKNQAFATLRSVHGRAGHLLYTAGLESGNPHPNGNSLYFTANGGSNWSRVGNVRDVWAVGLGAAATGQNYPTIWIVGFTNVNGRYNYGIAVCKDFKPALPGIATWTWLTDWPFGNPDLIVSISGDGNDPTKCYFTFQGSGAGYGADLSL